MLLTAVLAAVSCVASAVPFHGELSDKIVALDARIAAAPDDAALRLQRGELHRIHGDWSAAAADYEAARRLDPDLEAVELGLARLALDRGEPAAALAAVPVLLERQPDSGPARLLRAQALEVLGRPAAAAQAYEDAARHLADPRPEHYLAAARLHAQAVDHGTRRALRCLDAGLARLGASVPLELAALELEVELELWDRAVARLERLAAGTQRKESWWMRKAEVLERAGRTDAARRAWRDAHGALASLPGHVRARPGTAALMSDCARALARLDAAHGGAGTGSPRGGGSDS